MPEMRYVHLNLLLTQCMFYARKHVQAGVEIYFISLTETCDWISHTELNLIKDECQPLNFNTWLQRDWKVFKEQQFITH